MKFFRFLFIMSTVCSLLYGLITVLTTSIKWDSSILWSVGIALISAIISYFIDKNMKKKVKKEDNPYLKDGDIKKPPPSTR